MSNLVSYIALFVSVFYAPANHDKGKITTLPGVGIILNGDSILLNRTNLLDLKKAFNISEDPFLQREIWDGVDTNGNSTYGILFRKEIKFMGITFQYESPDTVNFKLKWIRIPFNKDFEVIILDRVRLGQINPPIDTYFKKVTKHDYIAKDRLTYNLYSQGISFHFEPIKKGRMLEEVSIHYRILGN